MSVANFFGETPTLPVNLTLGGGTSEYNGQAQTFQGVITIVKSATPVVVVTIPTTSGHSYYFDFITSCYVTAVSSGSDLGQAFFQRSQSSATNYSGTITINENFGNQFVTNGVSAGFSLAASGTNVVLRLQGNANDTIRCFYYVKVYYN